MPLKKTKKRSKQDFSHGSGSSSESDGNKVRQTHRRSERLKLSTNSPAVVDSAYDGDGETTEEYSSTNSDQVMRSVGSEAYDFEDDIESGPQTLLLLKQKMKLKTSEESKLTSKPNKKKNTSAEKSETKLKQNKPKTEKISQSVSSRKPNNFSVASILKTKFDNKIVDANTKSSKKSRTDNSVKSPPVVIKQNSNTSKKTPVTSKKTPIISNSKVPITSNTKTPVSFYNKIPINTKTPISSNTKTPVSFYNKNPINTKTQSTSNTNIPGTTSTKTSVTLNKSNTWTKSKTNSVRTTKRKAPVPSIVSPGLNSANTSVDQPLSDSGVFISPPPLKMSKLTSKDTSTPTNTGVEVVKESCFGFTSLNLVGSPMLSPVQKMSVSVTPTSDYCSAVFSLSQISMQDDSSDLKKVQQHSVFSADDLEPDIVMNKVSSKTYKASKQKRAKGRYSSSKVEAWAEKVNQEFDDLDNFELSIEG